jgi:photosystem II stability/assembly factor-like uncharacterized protein
MRSVGILVACVLLLSCQAKSTSQLQQAEWVSINQGLPSHAPVLALASTDGHTVYAAAYDRIGVYRSGGDLNDWTPDDRGLAPVPSYSLLAVGGTLWAGTAAGLFERNADSRVWERAEAVPNVAIYTISRTGGGTMLAGTDGRGVYSSGDAGKTWVRLPGLEDTIVTSVLGLDVETIFVGTSGHGLLVTHDGGASWASVPEFGFSYVPLLAYEPRDPRTLYASTRHALMRSRDAGTSWVTVEGGIEKQGVYAMLFSPDGQLIFAGTAGQGVFVSTDRGITWQHSMDSPQGGADASAAVPEGHAVLSFGVIGDVILAGTTDGVISSKDEGHSWTPGDFHNLRGIGTVVIHDLALGALDGKLFAATDDGLYSRSGGIWKRAAVGSADLGVLAVTFSPSDPRLVYSGTSHEGVFVSDDGGENWAAGGGDLGGRGSVAGIVVDPGNPKKLFARVLYERIYESTDGGDNWHTIWTGMRQAAEVEAVAIDPKDPAMMYAGGNDQLFHSNDAGERWVGGWLQGVTTFTILIDPLDSKRLLVGTTDGLYLTQDGGTNWERAGLDGITVATLVRDSSGLLFAGTKSDGAYISYDNGKTFTRFGSGLEGLSVAAMVVDEANRIIYAATNSGMFCLALGNGQNRSAQGASCL